MAISLSDERRQELVLALRGFYLEEFDEELSPFRAEQLLDHFATTVGPALYNQGVQDARGFMQRKLDDLDGEVHAPEAY